MPKKSRRERKRVQPRSAADQAASPATADQTPTVAPTDFAQPQSGAAAVTETTTATTRPDYDEDAEAILRTEDEVKRVQQTSAMGGVLAGSGFGAVGATQEVPIGGVTEPEVAHALRRVKRKAETAPANTAIPADTYTLSPDSAAVPMAQVPYVPSDLRRVAFSALVIVIFIVVSGELITRVIH